MEILGRDVAIAEYNLLCDMIDLDEDKRIEPTLKESDFEGKKMSDEEISLAIEKSDEARESIIRAIQDGTIEVTEENLLQKLRKPVKDKNGKILLDKLVWEYDHSGTLLAQNLKGIDLVNDQFRALFGSIATKTNQSRVLIGELQTRDLGLAKKIHMVFQSAS